MGLTQWEREYRRAARKDDYRLYERVLNAIQCEHDPKRMMMGTVQLVRLFAPGDRKRRSDFLAKQSYALSPSGPKYLVIVDLGHGYFGCIREDSHHSSELDLADLFECTLPEIGGYGFNTLWVMRADGSAMSLREMRARFTEIEYDVRFDYGKSEVDLEGDFKSIKGVLRVDVMSASSAE